MRLAREAGITAMLVAAALAAFAEDEAPRDAERLPVPSGAVARGGAMRGHAGEILALAFADADRLASAGEDGTVQVWDARTGAHEATIAVDVAFERASFSSDGSRVAYSLGARIRVVDVSPGARRERAKVDVAYATAGAPTVLAYGADDASVFFVDERGVAAVDVPPRGRGFPDGPRWVDATEGPVAVAGVRDPRWSETDTVAFARADGVRFTTIAMRPTDVGPVPIDRTSHRTATTALWLSKDAATYATGAAAGDFALWRRVWTAKDYGAETPGLIWRAGYPIGQPVSSIVVSSDGASIAAAYGTHVLVCDLATGAMRQDLAAPAVVRAVAISPNHRTVVCACRSGALVAWDVKDTAKDAPAPQPRTFAAAAVPCEAAAIESSGVAGIAVLATDGVFHVWATPLRETAALRPDASGLAPLAIAPDGAAVVRAGPDGAPQLVRLPSGDVVWTSAVHGATRAQFSADGTRIAVLAADGVVHMIVADDGKELFRGHACATLWFGGPAYFVPREAADGVRFLASDGTERIVADGPPPAWAGSSRDGSLVALPDGTTGLRVLRGGKEIAHLAAADGPRADVAVAAFSDDGAQLVAGTVGGDVAVFDVAHDFARRSLRGHHGRVAGVAFPLGGPRFVTCGADGTWIVWDGKTAK
jgi:WD40 repeat protein